MTAATDTMPALLPCPFCGNAEMPTIYSTFEDADEGGSERPLHNEYTIVCDAGSSRGEKGCGACGGYHPTQEEAIAAWNRRSTPADGGGQGVAPLTEEPCCPKCQGSGTIRAMTSHLGPDDYEFDEECPSCIGTGSADIRDAIKSLPYQSHTVKRFVEMVDRAAVLRIIDEHRIGTPASTGGEDHA